MHPKVTTFLLLCITSLVHSGPVSVPPDPWLQSKLDQRAAPKASPASTNSQFGEEKWKQMKSLRYQELKEGGYPDWYIYFRMASFAIEEGGFQSQRKDNKRDGSINLGKNNDNLQQLCQFGGMEVPILSSARSKYGGAETMDCDQLNQTPDWNDVDHERLLQLYKVDYPSGVVLSSENQKKLDLWAYQAISINTELFTAIHRAGFGILDGQDSFRLTPASTNKGDKIPYREDEDIIDYQLALPYLMNLYSDDPSKLTNGMRYSFNFHERHH